MCLAHDAGMVGDEWPGVTGHRGRHAAIALGLILRSGALDLQGESDDLLLEAIRSHTPRGSQSSSSALIPVAAVDAS